MSVNDVYHLLMYTVAETGMFSRYAADYWTESDRAEFAAWIARNPDAGDLIPGSGGCRKVRWSRPGTGKRGGVRVIYYPALGEQKIWLLLMSPAYLTTLLLRSPIRSL